MAQKKSAPKRAATRKDDGPAALKAVQAALANAPKRTLLASWRDLLSHIDTARNERIDQAAAARALYAWPQLKITDVRTYISTYYDFLSEMSDILEVVIEQNPGCLEHVEDDADHNWAAYMNVYLLWNQQIAQWSEDWNLDDENSYVQMAAQAAAQEFFVGNPQNGQAGGIIQYMTSARVEHTNEDDKFMRELITEFVEHAKAVNGE